MTTSEYIDPDTPDSRSAASLTALDTLGWELLARYFANGATDEDLAQVRAWVGTDLGRRLALDAMRAEWDRAGAPAAIEASDPDAAWQAMRGQMDAASIRASAIPVPARPRILSAERGTWTPVRLSGWRMAAAASLLLVLPLIWRLASPSRHAAIARQQSVTEFATRRGERATFRLADGSQVTLAAESRLRVPADYGVSSRDIGLDGQAFFVVRHDGTKPFRIHAGNAVAEDIGTEFSIRAYAGEPRVDVVVSEGVVALRPARAVSSASDPSATVTPGSAAPVRVVLARGELGRLSDDGQLAVTRGVNVSRLHAWLGGGLTFDGVPLRDAIADLARWYDLDIRLGDRRLETRRLVATFGGHQSASDVIALLALTLDVRYERQGHTVTFFSR